MLLYTQHALKKMDALGIEKREVERIIKEGMKWKEKRSGKWHAQMLEIEVIFIKQEKNFIIITTYFHGG